MREARWARVWDLLIFWWESCSFLAGVGGPFPLTTGHVATGRRKGASRYANFEGDLLPSGGLHRRLGLRQDGEVVRGDPTGREGHQTMNLNMLLPLISIQTLPTPWILFAQTHSLSLSPQKTRSSFSHHAPPSVTRHLPLRGHLVLAFVPALASCLPPLRASTTPSPMNRISAASFINRGRTAKPRINVILSAAAQLPSLVFAGTSRGRTSLRLANVCRTSLGLLGRQPVRELSVPREVHHQFVLLVNHRLDPIAIEG